MSLLRLPAFSRSPWFVFTFWLLVVLVTFLTLDSFALDGDEKHFVDTLLHISVLLVIAKFSGLLEKIGQPALIGQVALGIVLGNLALIGIDWFEPIKESHIIKFLAELGVVILLFQAGLESNLQNMQRTGGRAIMVAFVGAVLPFLLGAFIAAPLLLPDAAFTTHLFIGAALTATSVGIAATLFRSYGRLHTPEAQIILGAAVMDDVLGMVLLPVLTAIIGAGIITTGMIASMVIQAIVFLFGSIILGHFTAPYISKAFSKIDTGIGMKFTLALSCCLFFASLAGFVGIAPIIGAFAAGLFLDPVHFKNFANHSAFRDLRGLMNKLNPRERHELEGVLETHEHKHIEDLIDPLAQFMVPLFFITIGMAVDINYLFSWYTLGIALAILTVAIIARMTAGMFAGKTVNKTLVGVALIPNGEVGLVYAALGRKLGVVNDSVFAIVITVMVLSTLLAPIVLNYLLRHPEKKLRLFGKPHASAAT